MSLKPYIVKNRALFIFAVAITGAVAGTAVWAFFFLMNLGLGLLWNALPRHFDFVAFPLVLCTIGGVVIGLVEKRNGPRPEPLGAVMQTVRETGRYRYDDLGKSGLAAILPLIFGGSVGPEAGLTGIIAGLCTWVGDRLKRFGADFQELTRMGMSAALSAIFAAPLFGFVAPLCGDPERDNEITFPKKTKVVLYLVAIIGALTPFIILQSLVGAAGGLPRFTGMELGVQELIWFLPLLVLGSLAGWIYHAFDALAARIARLFGDRILLRSVVAGVVLGACGTLLPFTLFAGEHQLNELAGSWMGMGALVLGATCFVKLFVTNLCIRCGWRGGNIFPVIFAGVALGYATAAVSGCDPVFCIVISAACVCGGVMRNPLMASLLLILCFPITALPLMFVAALVGGSIPLPARWTQPKTTAKPAETDETGAL